MKRTNRCALLVLTAALIATVVLLACTDESRARLAPGTWSAQAFVTMTSAPRAAGGMIPTPTFRPTEQAPTPAHLDRNLETTAATRQQLQWLVAERVMPVVKDEAVLQAMLAVPRHAFVPTAYLDQAYGDHPLPIGYGQTISQPSLVAMMTEMLELEPDEKVLEIGTGSGYQAAILREITDQVYTIEIVPELAGIARRIFDELGYEDIKTLRADGYWGWWEHAPFDAIIVTAAPDHLPAPLVAQLNPDGGRMVIPIGPPGGYQSLWLVVRNGEEIEMQRVIDVAFVPFTREGE